MIFITYYVKNENLFFLYTLIKFEPNKAPLKVAAANIKNELKFIYYTFTSF